MVGSRGATGTYDELTRLAVELTGAGVAALTTGADPERKFLSVHGRPPAPCFRVGGVLPATHSMHRFLRRDGRPVALDDTRAHPELRDSPNVTEWGIAAWAGVPLQDDGGRTYAILAIADYAPRRWDATALRALSALGAMAAREMELRHSRDLAASLIEYAAEGAFVLDAAGRLRHSSSVSRAVFGYAPGELLGRDILEILHPDDVPTVRAALAELAGVPCASRSLEVGLRHRSGEWRRVVASATNRLAEEHVRGITVYLRDVTEQRRAEAALRESEERFRALIEHAQDVVAIIGTDGVIRYESPAVEAMLGFAPHELVGRPAREFVHPEDLTLVQQTLAGLAGDDTSVVTVKYRCLHRNGTYRTILARAWNAADVAAVGGIVVNARDVTDEEALATQLRQAQKLEAVGRLAGGVAHDFNNMLTVISARTTFAREDLPPNSPVQAELAEIEAATQRASRLTRQLLAFSRQQVLRPQAVDLNSVVEDIARMLARTLGDDIRTVVETAAEPVRTWADPSQIEQVLLNLAVNSRDAMPAGGTLTLRTARVEVDRRRAARHPGLAAGTYAALVVADTGTGMDAETQARMFEPFFTTKPAGRGTGLGLATVYGVVKQSGGYVLVQSALNAGTTITVLLPPGDCAPAAATPRPAARTLTPGEGTVLVVEDDLAVRLLVRRMLERGGYTVVEARNGGEALELLEGAEPRVDLLLTDAVMPVMGATELIPAARARVPRLKVLVMTGYSDELVDERGLGAEVGIVGKPFTADELLQRVGRELAGHTAP